jgi:hypothetical protein
MISPRCRLGFPTTALIILTLSGPSATAGDHHKRVIIGYVSASPTTPVAAAPVAAAPATYAAAPVAYLPVKKHYFGHTIGYLPMAAGTTYAAAPTTYAAAPVVGYVPAPSGATAAAPPATAAAPPATAAAAPPAGSMYMVGYYYGYQANTGGVAGAPVAAAPGAPGTVTQPPSGVRLTNTASRQEIVDQLKRTNSTLTTAQVGEELRTFKLKQEAKELYAAKVPVSVDALTDAEKQDAENLVAVALGNATTSTTSSGTSSSGGSSGSTATPAAPVVPVMPVYVQPVHPWRLSHPKLYNLLSN